MSFDQLLIDRVEIERSTTETTSSTRVVRDVWSIIATDVPAWVKLNQGDVSLMPHGQRRDVGARVYFKRGQDVRAKDVIVYKGQRLLVTFVRDVRGNHIQADIRTIDE